MSCNNRPTRAWSKIEALRVAARTSAFLSMKDIFVVQDEIALTVVFALKMKLLGQEKAAVLNQSLDLYRKPHQSISSGHRPRVMQSETAVLE